MNTPRSACLAPPSRWATCAARRCTERAPYRGHAFLAHKAYVLPKNPLRPSYYLYDTTGSTGQFAFELLTTPGSYELIVQAPGYHTRVQQFVLSRDTAREISLTSKQATIHSDWDGYASAPPKVQRLIDQALALLGDDAQIFESLTGELRDLAWGSLIPPGQPHDKDIVCADLVTIALHGAGVNHAWPVTVPPNTAYNNSHTANYYQPSPNNPSLQVMQEHEAWLPDDILIYWDGPLDASRIRHVNLYVGPYSGIDRSGNEHPASEHYEVVNASIDDDDPDSQIGEATLPMTRASCVNHRCGRASMLRLRHRQLWN